MLNTIALLSAFIVVTVAEAKQPPSDICLTLNAPAVAMLLPKACEQLVVVKAQEGFKAEITPCQRQGIGWHSSMPSFEGVIGKGGIASVGQKREGDFKTPVGLHPLGHAFGIQALSLNVAYKQITADDKVIDDPSSQSYNSWVTGQTDAKHYETMLIDLYQLGMVINYNMDPVVPGAGSAIFMHVWRGSNKPTAGCVAMAKPHLLGLLQWLDKRHHPYIYITK